jgi:hypothetical protein
MEQNPFWTADQEIPRPLWSPNVQCRIYTSPSLYPILSHMNLVYILTLDFLIVHFNIILPSLINTR